jgi:uncharacterized protein YacL|tara:strand:- start:281 stop:523 length:243 start_codon:yes stop_codon:yes gene_type:complete
MFKVILFITLGLIALVIINKLVSFFIKDSSIRYILYVLLIFLFILFVFIYREKNFQNYKGIYEPPRFNGEKVIPGKVVDE